MSIKFSEDFNAIVGFGRDEAQRTGNYSIGADQLLLGILRHGTNDCCTLLHEAGVNEQELKEAVDRHTSNEESIPYDKIESIGLSREGHNIISYSVLEATESGFTTVYPLHLLLGIMRQQSGIGVHVLADSYGLTYEKVLMLGEKLFGLKHCRDAENNGPEDGIVPPPQEQEESGSLLQEHGYDLTEAARQGKLDPLYGRDREIERIIQILGRRKKNNPILVGDPGVGKSAIISGLAARIANGQVPDGISGKKIISLDLASVVAGTKFRGDFEKRMKNIIKEASSRTDVILFIDEFHTIVGAGRTDGSLDAANILKPVLARGEMQCIGATTVDEFAKHIEKDGALDRRFQKVLIEKTDIQETISILRMLRPHYEAHHKVKYSDEALEACVTLSDRYINSRCLPDKAVDMMDESGSMVHLHGKTGSTVTPDNVATVVSRITGIPVGKIARSESERLLHMADELKKKVIGQDDAIDKLCKSICRSRAGIKDPGRPIGSFMFFGPTGVGKTLLAKTLADYLFDSEDNMVRIDMSEYMEKFAVTRLIGAPPGYVGFEDNGQLTEPVRRKPYCVVLLDEIEKAHPDIFNLLLQVLDDGRLTDSRGRTVSFRNTIIIMTSNAGSRDVAERGDAVGFAGALENDGSRSQAIVKRAIERIFPPEFLGRLDESLFFNSLKREDIDKIVDIEIGKVKERVKQNGFTLSVSSATKSKVAEKGFNPRFGARPLRKALLEIVEDPVSEKLIRKKLEAGNADNKIRI